MQVQNFQLPLWLSPRDKKDWFISSFGINEWYSIIWIDVARLVGLISVLQTQIFTISSLRCELSPTHMLKCAVACKSCVTHQALVTCNMSCAMLCKGTVQLLSLTELKSHLFWLYFIGCNHWLMKEERKPEYWEKTPDDKLQKMPHTKARKYQPQPRLEPAL